ncbi:MAG: hypothetical protein R3286_01255 [Gammaproteobacteria bacterium]|nr:hypothetical protein [Gammaproteobacteria bacterium]
MSETHKLHAIFPDKRKAEDAKALMMKSGAFSDAQLFLVEVPTLVDTDAARRWSRRRMSRIGSAPCIFAAVGAGFALIGAGASLATGIVFPQAHPLSAVLAAAGAGALLGLPGLRSLSRCRLIASRPASRGRRGSNWVLIAHARSEREANFAEDLLASTRLSRKLRVRRRRAPAAPLPARCAPANDERAPHATVGAA